MIIISFCGVVLQFCSVILLTKVLQALRRGTNE